MMLKKRAGFTLVELSIVLVILGLLVGGVLTGQSLIRAAELRSITTQYNNMITATNAFKDKYFALPGDMTNATSFWGMAAAGAACSTTVGTGTQTCNGDGDGRVHPVSATSNEIFRYWQHLTNAGLIEGAYDGTTHGSTLWSCDAGNSPKGKINNSYWLTYARSNFVGNPTMFDGLYNNTLQIGAAISNGAPSAGLLKPEEIWNIDTKMDDGKPATGQLRLRNPTALTDCSDTSVSSNMAANYLLSGTSPTCLIIFVNTF